MYITRCKVNKKNQNNNIIQGKMMDYQINDSTPLAMLTVGQQKQII